MRINDNYPMVFMRGGKLLQVARAYEPNEEGFVGLRNGCILARSPDAFRVAKALIRGGDPVAD